VWHNSVSKRRSFAVIKAVRGICSRLYSKLTQNARASSIQIRRRRQCLRKPRRARWRRRRRMLSVNSPVGPVRVQQRGLPGFRVHPQALKREDRAGALRQQPPERRRNLSQPYRRRARRSVGAEELWIGGSQSSVRSVAHAESAGISAHTRRRCACRRSAHTGPRRPRGCARHAFRGEHSHLSWACTHLSVRGNAPICVCECTCT